MKKRKHARRYRVKLKMPVRSLAKQEYRYGVFFPGTLLSCDEFGELSQGAIPKNVEWLDK